MRGVNKVTLIGNLGKDPEFLTLEGNIPVVKFPLATTESNRMAYSCLLERISRISSKIFT